MQKHIGWWRHEWQVSISFQLTLRKTARFIRLISSAESIQKKSLRWRKEKNWRYAKTLGARQLSGQRPSWVRRPFYFLQQFVRKSVIDSTRLTFGRPAVRQIYARIAVFQVIFALGRTVSVMLHDCGTFFLTTEKSVVELLGIPTPCDVTSMSCRRCSSAIKVVGRNGRRFAIGGVCVISIWCHIDMMSYRCAGAIETWWITFLKKKTFRIQPPKRLKRVRSQSVSSIEQVIGPPDLGRIFNPMHMQGMSHAH